MGGRLDALPFFAESADWSDAVPRWGMFLNDQLSDCTCASTAHALMLRTALAGHMLVPSDGDVRTLYEAVAGYVPGHPETDNGAVQADVCQYLVTTGFLGHKAAFTSPIDLSSRDDQSLDRIRRTIQLAAHCRLGVNLPDGAEEDFDAAEAWQIRGPGLYGHDMLAVGYVRDFFIAVTWGGLAVLPNAWVLKYIEEAHIEAFPDILRANGMTMDGVDWDQLAAGLSGSAGGI